MESLSVLVHTLARRLIVVAPFLIVGFGVEALTRTEYATSLRSVRFNLTCTAIVVAVDVLVGVTIALAVADLTAMLPGHGFLVLPFSVHPGPLEVVGMACLWLVLRDFFYYWFHRLQHHSAWLWPQHELHHSEECMNVTTAWRHHWLEFPLESVFVIAPLTYAADPPAAITVAVAMLANTIGHFIHLNGRISLGRWNWLLANPHTHRIHHSCAPAHLDKNFAAVFPLWDVLFGTFYQPARDEYPPTGLSSGSPPDSVAQAMLDPFRRWWRMARGHR